MTIVLVGVNHRTAPVAVRERLAEDIHGLEGALGTCHAEGVVDELTVLSTCNRLEVYACATDFAERVADALTERLAMVLGLPLAVVRAYVYVRFDDEAVSHVMRVACGLDSLVLGEAQVLGQVARAAQRAHTLGWAGATLSHLFNAAVRAGKRARSEAEIDRHATSVGSVAVAVAVRHLPSRSARVLVVGAGEMGGLTARALHRHGVGLIGVVNRTAQAAERLAVSVGGCSFGWAHLPEALLWADAVIVATGAATPVLTVAMMASAMARRNGRGLVLVDVAVPRNIDPNVDGLAGVTRFDIDDLHAVAESNAAQRRAAVPQVEAIVREESAAFARWQAGRQAVPAIRALRAWAQATAVAEVRQALNRLPDADPQTERVVRRMAHRLVNKLLHRPTVSLRAEAEQTASPQPVVYP